MVGYSDEEGARLQQTERDKGHQIHTPQGELNRVVRGIELETTRQRLQTPRYDDVTPPPVRMYTAEWNRGCDDHTTKKNTIL